MIQNLLLILLSLLCVLLTISLVRKPFESKRNPCKFKILSPKYFISEDNKGASFDVIVEKVHRYFINFPLSFKFYSDQKFETKVKITYSTPGEDPQLLLDKTIEFTTKTKEHVVYITDVILGKLTIEVLLNIMYGEPIIGFEILANNICDMTKEQKLELRFPKE